MKENFNIIRAKPTYFDIIAAYFGNKRYSFQDNNTNLLHILKKYCF